MLPGGRGLLVLGARARLRRGRARLARGERAARVAPRPLLVARRRSALARDRARLAAEAPRGRLGGDLLAARARRPRRDGHRALALRGGARPRGRAAARRRRLRRPDRAGHPPPRDGSAAPALPHATPLRRRPLVPGFLRARRRLGPGRAAHAGRAAGRRLRRERPEGVDQLRRRRRLVLPPLPHRARGAEAPRPEPAPRRHEEPGHHRTPLEADHGRRGVLGGLLRGRARAGRDDGGRARRRLADRDGHPRARARPGVDLHLPAPDPAEPRAAGEGRARAPGRAPGARGPGIPPAARAGAHRGGAAPPGRLPEPDAPPAQGAAGCGELDREGARQRDRPAPPGAGDGGARAVGSARRRAPPRLPLLPLGDDHGRDLRDPAQPDRPAHARAAAVTSGARGRPAQPSPLRRWLAPPFTVFVFLIHPSLGLWRPGGLLQDPGTGWHLVTGRYILDTGSVPARDLFSYTAAGHPWIDQSWLFDATSALLVRLGGLPLFATVSALVYAFIPALVFRRALRIGAGLAPALGLTVLAYLVLCSHAIARPHIVTYVFFALVLERLDDFQTGRLPARALWWLPLLALVWANVHGGFFIGLVLGGVFAGVAALRAVVFRDAEERRRALGFAAVLGAMGLATLVNPHGPRLHTAVQEYLSLRSIRYFHEFQSPDFLAASVPVLSFEALTLMLVLVLGLGGRRLPWVEMALLVLLLHQALHSARHMNLFAIVAAPIIAREITPWLDALRPAFQERWRAIAREQVALRSALLYFPALCALFVALSLAGVLPLPRTLDDLQLSRGAAEFIATHQDRFGRLFNTDDLGGTLIYRFWPRLRVFVDDRNAVYGDDFMMRRYYRVLYGQRGWGEVLGRYGVTAAVGDQGAQCTALLRASPGGELGDEDRLNAIFFRRDASGAPAGPR